MRSAMTFCGVGTDNDARPTRLLKFVLTPINPLPIAQGAIPPSFPFPLSRNAANSDFLRKSLDLFKILKLPAPP